MIINYRQAVPMVRPIDFVEYIQSSGTQYINTGFTPNSNTRVILDVQALSVSTVAYFGSRPSRSSGAYDAYIFFLISSNEARSDYDDEQLELTVPSVLNRVVIDKNKNVCYFGDTVFENTASEFSCSDSLLLLTTSSNGEVDSRKMQAKLYSCKIYDNDVLVRDYSPALDPDGIPCLYEKLSKTYAYNSGTGEFIASS